MLKVRQLACSLEHGALHELIPKDHLLKRIAAVVDFSFANEKFADSYCRFYGRPAKEPELMFYMQRARYRSLLRVYLQAVMACVVANAKRMTKLALAQAS